jgi:molybdopterin converting factor small subunit
MQIDVEIFGQLLPGMQRRQTLALERSITVGEVAGLLGLNLEEIGLVVVNGVQGEENDSVLPDCRLCFFPPMSGG